MAGLLRRTSLVAFAMLLVVFPGWAQQAGTIPEIVLAYPNMIVYNGKIVSMDDRTLELDGSVGTVVQAMAVRDDKILAMGSTDEILRLAGPRTQRIDLQGRTVIPGIINPHVHIHRDHLGYWFSNNPEAVAEVFKSVSVGGKTVAELRQAVELSLQEEAPKTRPGQWLSVKLPRRGLDEELAKAFLEEGGVTLQDLDRWAPNTPVMVSALRFIGTVINTAARKASELEQGFSLAGLKPNGSIPAHTEAGPELVQNYFHNRLDLLADRIEDATARHAAVGTTTHATHVLETRSWDAFVKLDRESRLPIRLAYTVARSIRETPYPAEFAWALNDMQNHGTDYIWMVGVGQQSLDSGPPRICSTMEAPQEIKERELCRIEPGNIYAETTYKAILARHRLTVGHIYADKALDHFMDEIDRAINDDPSITLEYIRSRHFTSDHCGFYPRPSQIPRIAKYGMIIACNPGFLDRSAPWLNDYSDFYANWISPFKSLVAGGVMTVFEGNPAVEVGSGYTYFWSVPHAMTRTNSEGKVLAPEEAVDRITLMKMMTTWGGDFVGRPELLGTLEPGKWADFVVLNQDYFTVTVDEIAKTFPLMTVLGGKTVVLRQEFAQELGVAPAGPQIDFTFQPAPNWRGGN